MTFTTTQKIIKIGSSKGAILPAKALKELNVGAGDEIELVLRKKTTPTDNKEVLNAAQGILDRYKKDFKNLADR